MTIADLFCESFSLSCAIQSLLCSYSIVSILDEKRRSSSDTLPSLWFSFSLIFLMFLLLESLLDLRSLSAMPPVPAPRARNLNYFFFALATVAGSSFLYVFHTVGFLFLYYLLLNLFQSMLSRNLVRALCSPSNVVC